MGFCFCCCCRWRWSVVVEAVEAVSQVFFSEHRHSLTATSWRRERERDRVGEGKKKSIKLNNKNTAAVLSAVGSGGALMSGRCAVVQLGASSVLVCHDRHRSEAMHLNDSCWSSSVTHRDTLIRLLKERHCQQQLASTDSECWPEHCWQPTNSLSRRSTRNAISRAPEGSATTARAFRLIGHSKNKA